MKLSLLPVGAFLLLFPPSTARADPAPPKQTCQSACATATAVLGASGSLLLFSGLVGFYIGAGVTTGPPDPDDERFHRTAREVGGSLFGVGAALLVTTVVVAFSTRTVAPGLPTKASLSPWLAPTGDPGKASGFVFGVSGNF